MAPTAADTDRILSLINAKDIQTLKKEDFDIFQYQGFDPYRLVQALIELKISNNIDDNTFTNDITMMVGLGLIKGNVNQHNITKMSDDGQKDLRALMTKYNIKMGGGKGQAAEVITFPRVMATFADVAVKMTKVLGGKEFRGGPFHSYNLPDVMKVQVFPAVIPRELDRKVKQFFLIASLCYSVDQTIQISNITAPDAKALCATQFSFVNLSHNSPLPKDPVRKQTFNQLGLPSEYSNIHKVVSIYKTEVDPNFEIIDEKEYKTALALV